MKYWAGDQTLEINMRDRAQLFDEIRLRFDTGTGFALATLNMDHLVKIGSDPAFAAAYADHDLIVADGRPVVWLSRLAGQPVALLPGSDLVEPLCGLAEECDVAVALVGSDAATLEAATAALCARMPGLRVALCVSPPMGFDPDEIGRAHV